MIKKIILKTVSLLAVTSILSCNKEDSCSCKEYRVTSNGILIYEGETSMQHCDNPNSSPQLVKYEKQCN